MKRSLALAALFVALLSWPLAAAETHTGKEVLSSGKVVPKTVPFSEGVRVGELVFLSGELGNVPGTMKLVEGGIRAEAKQTMENIKTVLEAHGLSMNDLVKCTVMLADIGEWQQFNEVYKTYFTDDYPARSAFGTSGLGLGARVEVECIAAVPR
jgi:2-iminobutanoate/2-iminopropanoate deaminase